MNKILKKFLSFLPANFLTLLRFYWRKYLLEKKNYLRVNKKRKIIRMYGKITLEEIFNIFKKLGLTPADLVFFQSSFDDLHNVNFKPIDLLNRFLKFFNKSGGLFVPSFTNPQDSPNWIFDYKKEPTYTGLFNEFFRREKKVLRSLHPRHSICGFGRLKYKILKDHEKCKYACGKNSPFDKLRKYKNSKILTLGLPKGYISFLHWMDDIEQEKFKPRLHENTPKIYKYYKKNKVIGKIYDYQIKEEFRKNLNYKKIINSIPQNKIIFINYKGILIGVYSMHKISRHLLDLKKLGKSMYQ